MNSRLSNIILPVICGLTAANMYYIQALIPAAAQVTGVGYDLISMIYTMALIGSAIGLTFITPIGDFINRKKIIASLYMMLFVALLIFYIFSNVYALIIIAFFIGLGSCAIPIITTYLTTNEIGGVGVIGKIMAGVLFGILLSRFASSFFASFWGWKSIYLFASVCMLVASGFIGYFLPRDAANKEGNIRYVKMAFSSFSLLKSNASVRAYSLVGFLIMAIFAAFWNNISIYLKYQFGFDQFLIGLFSLAGIVGALAAMFSNKIIKFFNVSNAALFVLLFSSFFLMTFYSNHLVILVVLTLVLDGLIQIIHVNNQVNMYGNCPGNESRAASCYMTSFVLGGAVGSKLSTYIYSGYGWSGLSAFCCCLCVLGLMLSIKKFYAREEVG